MLIAQPQWKPTIPVIEKTTCLYTGIKIEGFPIFVIPFTPAFSQNFFYSEINRLFDRKLAFLVI